MKVNIANYVYHDLLNRFATQNDETVDSDLIDVLITKWDNKEYFLPDSSLKLRHIQKIRPPHLM
ncbi:MAG: hypothetical protein IJ830_01875 [Alphaproteobacteria bacterium]|nr:hypothetical protein [Alphaproteobacteria bacterium]